MLPMKPGGGSKPETFDPETGEYSEEEKTKLFDKEMTNIVTRYIFGMPEDTYYPRFPIFGFHNSDYAKIYVENAVSKIKKDISLQKITNYLLKYRPKDDKSYFFNSIGYSYENSEQLYEEIYYGSDFSELKFQKFNEFGIFVAVPTIIKNIKTCEELQIITYWIYKQENGYMHFVSVNISKKEILKWKR